MKLSTKPATTSMIATIHTLKGRLKMEDDTYRDLLEQQAQKRSAKDLSVTEAGRVIDRLRELAGDGGIKGAVAGLDSAIGGKLRALWIAGYDLGIVRDRTDRAMLSYLERQTGVSHVRFLADAGVANKAIEGLKRWMARDAKVEWPTDSSDVRGAKRAILAAQWLRLIELRDVIPSIAHHPLRDLDLYAWRLVGMNGWNFFDLCHLDQVQNALGRKLRAALAKHGRHTITNQET